MDFSILLKQCGLKSTKQRITVLNAVREAGHLDVKTLQTKVDLPTGTLYRVACELKDAGILNELLLGHAVYELAQRPHAHMICEKCGFIKDMDITSDPMHCVEHASGFDVKFSALSFYGVCSSCKK